jgi:hypothetical protein
MYAFARDGLPVEEFVNVLERWRVVSERALVSISRGAERVPITR